MPVFATICYFLKGYFCDLKIFSYLCCDYYKLNFKKNEKIFIYYSTYCYFIFFM